MKKSNLISGIIGLTLGCLVTFIVLSPPMRSVKDAQGKIQNCPIKNFRTGELIEAQRSVKPNSHVTYQDRAGCEYILFNVGEHTIQKGQTIQIMNVSIAKGGSTFMEVELPTG